MSVVDRTHGIHPAKSDGFRLSRHIFVEKALQSLVVYPVILEIAQLAGRIEGEEAAKGVVIPFTGLLIGATALYLTSM